MNAASKPRKLERVKITAPNKLQLEALKALQKSLKLTSKKAHKWEEAVQHGRR